MPTDGTAVPGTAGEIGRAADGWCVIEMPDSSGTGPRSGVPIDAIPHPVARYTLAGEGPIIEVRNRAFTDTFERVSNGTPFEEFLRRDTQLDAGAIADVCTSLSEGGSVEAEVWVESGAADADRGYRLQELDGSDNAAGDGGYVMLTPGVEAEPDGLMTERIASVISHDLRNPLDVANAHLRAARETGDEDHFDEIRRSHDRMEQIIEDVLTLARGEQAFEISRSVDVASIAADAWSTVETNGASLTVEDDLPETPADPDRLQRLFENLYRNSVEHARPGGDSDQSEATTEEGAHEGTVTVAVGAIENGFYLEDDGTGIPPEDRDRVFEPGYSTEGSEGGTGLGLTIVEQIAQAHHWHVSLTESASGGARFEFRFDTA